MKKYLIYKIVNNLTGRIYIGAHITNNINDMYFGSSKHLKLDIKKLGKENFSKEILFTYDNKEDMMSKERELVNKDFCYDNNTYNRMIGGISGSFNYNDMTTVVDINGDLLKVYLDDPRYLSGELVSIHKNTITVKDNNGKSFRVSTDDPRYLSGELVFERTGKVNVRDNNGNQFSVSKDDPRYLSGELVHILKGYVTVKDQNDNIFNVSKDDPRYLSGELIHMLSGTIVVKDEYGNRFVVLRDDPRYLSGELVGWAKGRPGIKGMLGKKRTEEQKEHLRKLAINRNSNKSPEYKKVGIHNTIINKMILAKDLEEYIKNGWIVGRKGKNNFKK